MPSQGSCVIAPICQRPIWRRVCGSVSRLLFAVESRRPLPAFDILGFSLSYELGATNILEMLDLCRVPIRAPIVVISL